MFFNPYLSIITNSSCLINHTQKAATNEEFEVALTESVEIEAFTNIDIDVNVDVGYDVDVDVDVGYDDIDIDIDTTIELEIGTVRPYARSKNSIKRGYMVWEFEYQLL